MSLDFSVLKTITSQTSPKGLAETLKFVGYPSGFSVLAKEEGVVKKPHPPRQEVLKADESDQNAEADRLTQENNRKEQEQAIRLDFDPDYVTMLRAENDRLTTLIDILQEKIDESLPNLKIEVELSIVDYPSAYEATVYYSKDWFANSLFSDSGKIDFAAYLLDLIKPYCGVNLDTLEMLANGDADLLAYTRIPRSNS